MRKSDDLRELKASRDNLACGSKCLSQRVVLVGRVLDGRSASDPGCVS